MDVSGITDTANFVGTSKKPEDKPITPPDPVTPSEPTPTPEPVTPPPVKDVTPPEEVRNLMAAFEKVVDKYLIKMSWLPSLNTAGDLVDQMFYTSMDRGGSYDVGKSLGPTATKHELPNMEGGKEYTFKLTTKDLTGNESTGVVKSIRLPQTGPIAAIGVGSSLLAAYFISRRKKK